jgi:hypothetical protein
MSTLAILRRAAVFATLSLAACAGAPTESNDAEEHEGIARSALAPANTVYFSEAISFSDGIFYSFTADTPDLTWMDNMANALKNDTAGPVTLWSGKGFTGRCQTVPGGAGFPDLSKQDIGPNRLSSIQFGDHCSGAASKAQVYGPAGYTVKTLVNGVISATTTIPAGATTALLPIPTNAWQIDIRGDQLITYLNVQSDETVSGNVAVAVGSTATVYDSVGGTTWTWHIKGTASSALYTFKTPITSMDETEDAAHIKQVHLVLP